jgi:hypothetical protein
MTNSSGKDKADYMKDYQEYNSDDDYEAGADDNLDFDSDADTDLRDRYGQSALAKEMARPSHTSDLGLSITQFDELEALLENSRSEDRKESAPSGTSEPKLRIPDGYMPSMAAEQKTPYKRKNWVADGEEKQ